MKTLLLKIEDWIYRKLIQKKHLEWTKQSYDRGFSHGIADAEHWHRLLLQEQEDKKKIIADRDTAIKYLEDEREMFRAQRDEARSQLMNLETSWFVDPEKVLTVNASGLVFLKGEQITERELLNLKSEIRSIKGMQFYDLVQNTIRAKAVEKAVLTSTDLYSLKGNEQVLAGKMMIYNLDIIKTLVEKIDKAKIK